LSGMTIGPGGPVRPDLEPLQPAHPEAAAGAAPAAVLRFGARGDDVKQLQTALHALGLLAGPIDGVFGRGTERAVATFQRQHGLTPDGVAGPRTRAALTGPRTAAMADAAKALVEKRGENYGVSDPWFNVDGRHALPANVPLGGMKGKWKCNLFAGNTMAAAGFEPPYYGNRGRGEYPNANQLYKWSDQYAAQFGNKGHERFELRGELDPQALQGADREAAIRALLEKAEPGDMIIVDHMGGDVADGGHCRVVVKNDLASGGNLENAQASFDSALVRSEGVPAFMGEEHIWILRPNKPRAEGPAPV
jgi:hypothetical protein